MSDATKSHREQARDDDDARSLRCAVLTVSDTRAPETDGSGDLIAALLGGDGHHVAHREIVRDEADAIRTALEAWLADPEVRVILTTGGTGISRRDTTIEVVRMLLTAHLDGFGELFRMLSYDEVGAAAMLSRAVAGLVARDPGDGGDTFVFAMPGSPNAVETAMRKLVLPEVRHLVWERGKEKA